MRMQVFEGDELKFSIEEKKEKEFHIPTWLYVFAGIFIAVVFIFSSLQITFNVVYHYYPVTGASMQPTINRDWQIEGDDADGVYVNTFNKGERGDIIVVQNPPSDSGKTVIKRLIAVGGDKIAICPASPGLTSVYNLLVIYKGETKSTVLPEDYLSEDNKNYGNAESYRKFYSLCMTAHNDKFEYINGLWYLVIPEGQVFFMGDNRSASKDCSEYGPVSEANVVGKVDIIIKNRTDFVPQILAFFGDQIVKLFV